MGTILCAFDSLLSFATPWESPFGFPEEKEEDMKVQKEMLALPTRSEGGQPVAWPIS